jgi:plastocyanin
MCRKTKGLLDMIPFTFALTLAFIGGLATAYAAERKITQKGKVFSESEVTIKKGDVIVFVNDDSVHHNVLSTSVGNIFNSGAVAPGGSTPVTFNAAGEVSVICAIHPSMKLKVTITN